MKGVFKCAKEDDERNPGVSNTQAWGCPMNPQEIFKETQESKLGDAPSASPSPSTIISSSFSTLYFYHFICYVLYLERLAFTFLVYLFLHAIHNKLDPILHCLGEKHAPLHPRTQHRFSCLSLMCVLYIF